MVLWTLIAAGGCTRANPAFRVRVAQADAAAEPEAPPEHDARADFAAHDLPPAPPDVAPSAEPPPIDLSPPRADDSVVTRSLVAHWRFDEGSGTSVRDATGNGNDGSTRGGPTWSAGALAIRFANAAALVLDGDDDFVELTNDSIPASETPKSITLWLKATAPAAIPIRTLVALTNDPASAGVQLGLDHGRVAAWLYGDLGPMVAAPMNVDGEWHHAAYTYDGVTHRIYYDGQTMGSGVVRAPRRGAIVNVRLGTWEVPMEMFAGAIDDVRIYSRALDPVEVAALAAGQ
jgi:hypothetical protein